MNVHTSWPKTDLCYWTIFLLSIHFKFVIISNLISIQMFGFLSQTLLLGSWPSLDQCTWNVHPPPQARTIPNHLNTLSLPPHTPAASSSLNPKDSACLLHIITRAFLENTYAMCSHTRTRTFSLPLLSLGHSVLLTLSLSNTHLA